jgi:hypothetical protein
MTTTADTAPARTPGSTTFLTVALLITANGSWVRSPWLVARKRLLASQSTSGICTYERS